MKHFTNLASKCITIFKFLLVSYAAHMKWNTVVKQQMAVDVATGFRLPVLQKARPGSCNITDTSAIRKSNLFPSVGNIL